MENAIQLFTSQQSDIDSSLAKLDKRIVKI